MIREVPDVQAGFRKGRETRDQIANIRWIIKKAREFRKTFISALLTMPNPLTVWITIKCGKLGTRWEYQTITSWEIDGETVETVSDFIVLGYKITANGDCSHEIKRHLLLERKL